MYIVNRRGHKILVAFIIGPKFPRMKFDVPL